MRKWYPWIIVVLTVVFTAAVFGRLPERIPTHWDAQGTVNGEMDRLFGAWLLPAMIAAMALVLPRLPAIDPRRANYDKFRPSYDLVINAVITMMAILHVAMLGVALGWPVSMERVTPLMAGMLFIVLGNVLPRARPNWLFGIRTPWTLTNDRVWERTHRVGGMLFVVAGVVLMLSAFLKPHLVLPAIVTTVVVAAVIPIAYSYFIWKEEVSGAPHA
jgi:uncharacterized membrane protein